MRRNNVAVAFAAAAVLSVCVLGAVGCGQQPQESAPTQAAASPEAGSMQSWAEKYPNQYNSIFTNKMRDGVTHGHDALVSICEAPVVRVPIGSGAFLQDDEGHFLIDGFTYDAQTGNYIINTTGNPADNGIYQSCVACKSSRFNELYEADDLGAFTEGYTAEAAAVVDGQYWDCAMCHSGEPGETVGANGVYFTAMLGDRGQDASEVDKACGQCHNSFDYERMVQAGDDIYRFDPYRYGFDADSLLRAALEDGLQGVDEESGVEEVMVFHPEFEFFQNSTHDSMGLDCASCHMPTSTSEDGEEFTNHDASGSPLENPDALAVCLSCHESQGINSPDAMVEMVRGKQAEAARAEQDLTAKLDTLKQTIAAKAKAGATDTQLQSARSAYTTASYYLYYVTGRYADDGVKVAHNPVGTFDYLSRADKLVTDAMADLK